MSFIEDSKQCVVAECTNRRHRREWCKKHYTRLMKYGDVHFTKYSQQGDGLNFLRSLVGTTSTECILWPYPTTSHGYGRIRFRGNKMNAHRVMLFLSVGDPPQPGMQAAHKPIICHNRLCVNPNHVEWKTAQGNVQDTFLDGTRRRKTRQTKLFR